MSLLNTITEEVEGLISFIEELLSISLVQEMDSKEWKMIAECIEDLLGYIHQSVTESGLSIGSTSDIKRFISSGTVHNRTQVS